MLPQMSNSVSPPAKPGVYPNDINFSAEEVAAQVGVSRSTARRYLEYLISEGFLFAELIYGVVGRPERRYFRHA